jgi:hypothetical protein
MSIVWLTAGLGILMLLSAAVIIGTLALGLVACLLSRSLEWLLGLEVPSRMAPADRLLCRSSRSRRHHQKSRVLSA